LNPSARKKSALARRVAADVAAHGWHFEGVLSDNGQEFRSHEFGETVPAFGGRQRFMHPGRPTTNVAIERVQRTILEECWRRSFARSLVPKLNDLSRDLEAYCASGNQERPHTGRLTQGLTPP
jgi:transposase InsO family protein